MDIQMEVNYHYHDVEVINLDSINLEYSASFLFIFS